MRKRKTPTPLKFPKLPLPICVVRWKGNTSTGFLFFENSKYVILLTDISEAVDIGQLRTIRKKHIEPETDILVLPNSEVEELIRL